MTASSAAWCLPPLPVVRDDSLVTAFFLPLLGGIFLRFYQLGLILLVVLSFLGIHNHRCSPCRANARMLRWMLAVVDRVLGSALGAMISILDAAGRADATMRPFENERAERPEPCAGGLPRIV
ncbi:MAG: hypothetical protein KYX69_11695 [Sphingomonas sp.]|uniref:hypothetical protein n=1 Tax=Sphingomonas sp. TaxID=28214 RepID=UPI002628FAEF|nr:hypothetical protein [Sphingomonas sp.]MDK2768369.1 hypothetical protein [Sphingomonas sp.]